MNAALFVKQAFGPHRYLNALLAIVSLIVISSVAAADIVPVGPDLITNGSFETTIVPVGGFTNFSAGRTAIPGWTVVGPGGSLVSGSFVTGCCTFPASDGTQWLDLTGSAVNQVSGVEQTIATIPGRIYNLAFDWGNVVGTTSEWKVLIDGVHFVDFLDTCHVPGSGGPCTNILTWHKFGGVFTASGSTTVIEFLGKTDAINNNSNGLGSVTGLDNVTLRLNPAPEPATLGLLGLGLAGVGLFRRRSIVTTS